MLQYIQLGNNIINILLPIVTFADVLSTMKKCMVAPSVESLDHSGSCGQLSCVRMSALVARGLAAVAFEGVGW